MFERLAIRLIKLVRFQFASTLGRDVGQGKQRQVNLPGYLDTSKHRGGAPLVVGLTLHTHTLSLTHTLCLSCAALRWVLLMPCAPLCCRAGALTQ